MSMRAGSYHVIGNLHKNFHVCFSLCVRTSMFQSPGEETYNKGFFSCVKDYVFFIESKYFALGNGIYVLCLLTSCIQIGYCIGELNKGP